MSCRPGCCCCEEESPEESNRPMSSSPMKRNVCCTDVVFLILFIAFWGGMIYIAVFSIIQGAALRLVYGYDSFGNACHSDNNDKIDNVSLSGRNTANMGEVFFSNIRDPIKSMQLCVSRCPDKDLETARDVKDFFDRSGSRLCDYNTKPEDYLGLPDSSWSGKGPCPSLPVYKSLSLLNRCVPDLLDPSKKNITASIIEFLNEDDDMFRKVLSDLFYSWKEMLALCFIALGISLIMVFLIRYLASIIVWVIVVLAVVASIAGTAFLWWTYADMRNKVKGQQNLDIPLLEVDISNERAFLIFAIIATVLTVILLLIIIVMRNRIALVVALFHEAGKAIASMPSLLIQPLWTFLILLVFFFYWVIVLGFLSTAGYPTANYKKVFGTTPSVEYKKSEPVRYFWWYHLVGLIWTSEFILACQQMVISGAVAMWYFTRDKGSLSCAVGKATSRLILHHIGSVAFGAFLITLVKLPRLILMYIQKKAKGSENPCAQFCLKCCICCLWCLEKCLKFLNQNAYTIVAIEGKSFCPAAKKAFMIIASNVLRVAAINSVGDFVLFLGKIAVMATTGAIGIVWFKAKPEVRYYAIPALIISLFAYLVAHCVLSIYENIERLHFYAIPVLLVCVFAFLIAHCFLSIYEMVIDTLLLCFCEDCQLNDGTEGREYFMSPSLMKFVNNSSKKLKNPNRKQDGEAEEERASELNARSPKKKGTKV